MKSQLFKKFRVVLPIVLAMVLVAVGVIGISGGASAAAKGTTYTVTVGTGSVGESQVSINNLPALKLTSTFSGSFQMIVDAKGGFVIPAKSLKITQTMGGAAAGYVSQMTIKKDIKGKLKTGGTVTGVFNGKKLAVKMGNKGPDGSLTAVMDFITVTTGPDGSKQTIPTQITFTTSSATVSCKGTKPASGIEGKSISGTGAPLGLPGTGKLVGIGGSRAKTAGGAGQPAGQTDTLTLMTFALEIK
jgi:hypothetical protein